MKTKESLDLFFISFANSMYNKRYREQLNHSDNSGNKELKLYPNTKPKKKKIY